ncbi:Na/Pi symporter [Bacillus pumilus]|uniref:Na/Pi symporter n=1 Tax=Bacillus pumilus TaxID=1408 RepID=UPI0011A1DCDF|nr:Na/Pi symporter [Bacillus pumilus]
MMAIIYFCALIFIFLWSMGLLRKGLMALASSRIEKSLLLFTDHPVKAFLVSIIFTGILQSSSAFMVIVIGFVSTGILSFKKSIPMILGTNIGSTFTTEFIAIKMDVFMWVLILVGLICMILGRKSFRHAGKSIFGLGMIFFCIQGFSKIAGMMTSQPETLRFLEMMQHSDWTALLSGTIFTAIVHSSSVCIGILMGFMNEGTVGLQEGISFVLGSNIGTCITAVMAAISGGYAARQTAYAHVLFNVLGVLLCLPFLAMMTEFVALLANTPAQQIAHFSLLFNVASSLLFFPFIRPFHTLILCLLPNQSK